MRTATSSLPRILKSYNLVRFGQLMQLRSDLKCQTSPDWSTHAAMQAISWIVCEYVLKLIRVA